ncbi:DUF1905 domain-containing protein [Erythrobacter insulae]|uniref:DUF1905 domain-containing protein n=1 Tax=Erythrobacter insulae TaxID=2584124 RepID=A0A547PCR7_9SPHN|nr:DUF1905 domain-containing protein [Erythrobacter insulae]TRD11915.1 DUF1905 domain-containing protein [Erythrobacter insulae]
MSETLSVTLPLTRWQGDRGTYRLVTVTGDAAETLAIHARLHRLEFGRSRGFGSVKVVARIGETEWKSSVFPQKHSSQWVLLISRKVIQRESLTDGHPVQVTLNLI